MTVIVGLSDAPLGRLGMQGGAEEAARRGEPLVIAAGVVVPRYNGDRTRYPQQRRRAEDDS